MQYDAFISYSHQDPLALGAALQRGLAQFARPFLKLRALRVFRDVSNLSASPSLWTSIERALADSEYFILVASPAAAKSKWIAKEIEYWTEHRPLTHLLIVLTSGSLVWDDIKGDFDWDRTDAVPRALARKLPDQPLYVDLTWASRRDQLTLRNQRFVGAIADLASAIRGVPKDTLHSQDLREHRRRLRWTRAAATALIILTIGLGIATILAVRSQNAAVRSQEAAVQSRDAAERRLVDSLFSNAESSRIQGQWQEASQFVDEAAGLMARRGDDPFEATYQRWRLHFRSPPPLYSVPLHESGWYTFANAAGRGFYLHDDTVESVDMLTGRRTGVYLRNQQPIEVSALSPDGRHMLLGSADGTVAVWSGSPPIAQRLFKGHSKPPRCIELSPNGRLVASMSDDVTLVWDLASGRTVWEVPNRKSSCPVFRGANQLVSIDNERQMALWDIGSRKPLRTFRVDTFDYMFSTDVSRDGRLAVSAGRRLRLWDLETGMMLREFRDAREPIFSAVFALGDEAIVANTGATARWRQGTLTQVFNARTGSQLYTFKGFSDLEDLKRSPEQALLTHWEPLNPAGADAAPDRRDAEQRFEPQLLSISAMAPEQSWRTAEVPGIVALEFSPDSRLLIANDRRGNVYWVDTVTMEQIVGPEFSLKAIRSLTQSGDGSRVAAADGDGNVEILALRGQWRSLRTVSAKNVVVDTALSIDGSKLLTADVARSVTLWDVADGRSLGGLRSEVDIDQISFTDSDDAAVISGSGRLGVWRFDGAGTSEVAWHEVADLGRESQHASRLGWQACHGGREFEVNVLNLRNADSYALHGHRMLVTGCDFSPDQRWMVSSSTDGALRFWSLDRKRSLPPLDLAGQPPRTVRYAPSGNLVAVSTYGGELHILDFAVAMAASGEAASVNAAVTALTKNPRDTVALERVARWYATRQLWTLAAGIYDELETLGSPLAEVLPAARTYWILGRYKEARRWFEEAGKRGEASEYYLTAVLATLKLNESQQPRQPAR